MLTTVISALPEWLCRVWADLMSAAKASRLSMVWTTKSRAVNSRCACFNKSRPVHDEIEFRHDALFGVIVSQVAGVVIGKRGFAGALGVPNHAFFAAVCQMFFNGESGK